MHVDVYAVLASGSRWRPSCASRTRAGAWWPFAAFAAHGAVLRFAVSSCCSGAWSAMRSLAALGLLFVGPPWLLVRGIALRRARARSAPPTPRLHAGSGTWPAASSRGHRPPVPMLDREASKP
jgi:hypothetical protein